MLDNFLNNDSLTWVILRFAATMFATTLVTKLFRVVWRRLAENTIHLKFIKNVLSVLIWAAGTVFALSHFPNFTTAVTALLAGSGIVALTIGLAAQESLGNAFNGLFISLFKPFEVGDRVHLVNANITGFVEDITVRHTVVRTLINSRIIVPNSVLSHELIENSNFQNAQASAFIDVIIVYGSDVAKACEIVAEVIGGHADFIDTRTPEQLETAPKVPVFVRALGLYGIELRANMWTETIATNFAACSDVRKGILEEFERNSIKIASSKIITNIEGA